MPKLGLNSFPLRKSSIPISPLGKHPLDFLLSALSKTIYALVKHKVKHEVLG